MEREYLQNLKNITEPEYQEVEIKVYNIDYDITEEDLEANEVTTEEELLEKLPKELELTIEYDVYEDNYETHDSMIQAITDAISDETGMLVNDYEYEFLS